MAKLIKKQIEGLAVQAMADSFDTPHIEIDKNGRAVVEGSRGIIEYNGSVVRVNCGELIVKFSGEALRIQALAADVILVSGEIVSLEFCT